MSGGLSRRAATPAPAAIAARSTASRRSVLNACAVFGARGASAVAATWPAQPIRLVAPIAPGGTTDLVARLATQDPGKRLGQSLIIDNRPAPAAARLSRELNAVLATRGRSAGVGGQAGALPPEERTAFIRFEAAHRKPLVRASGAAVG